MCSRERIYFSSCQNNRLICDRTTSMQFFEVLTGWPDMTQLIIRASAWCHPEKHSLQKENNIQHLGLHEIQNEKKMYIKVI